MATVQVATLFLLVLVAAASALSRVLAVPYPMRGLYEFRYRRLAQRAGYRGDDDEEDAESRSHDYQRIVHGVLAAQRRELIRLRDGGEIGDDALNVILRELDLEEERLDS